jgi:dihydrofolate synthase/folylpolyglutamate synthase
LIAMPTGVRFASLSAWLDWQQTLHPQAIDLGLARVARVLARTGWRRPTQPVITVGGTNGKGSCVAMLDAILRAGGHRVGTFTSPHLVDYRERIRLDGRKVSEASLVAAFERIADALGEDSLTFFEFNTLASLLVFETFAPDVIVLEVGMGGRLDAVNVVDADVAIVVSVGLDHTEWLGADVESIGREKAGIFRAGRPAVCGMPEPPRSVVETARDLGTSLKVRGHDFDGIPRSNSQWDFAGQRGTLAALPLPALPGQTQVGNAATVLAALEQLGRRVDVDRLAVEQGLRTVELPGRFQRLADPRGFEWILDVAHNPDSARVLAGNLAHFPARGRTLAVCAMLGDKDVAHVLGELRTTVDEWFAAGTEGPRGLSDVQLAERAKGAGIDTIAAGTVIEAMTRAAAAAGEGDRIVVFGSFHTVGPALSALQDHL